MPPVNDIQWAQLVGFIVDELHRRGLVGASLKQIREERRIQITSEGLTFEVSLAHRHIGMLDPPFNPAAEAEAIVANYVVWSGTPRARPN
jgi:hypothetical protein